MVSIKEIREQAERSLEIFSREGKLTIAGQYAVFLTVLDYVEYSILKTREEGNDGD